MKKSKTVRVSVSMPADLHAAIQKMAEDDGRSMSRQIAWLLAKHVLVQVIGERLRQIGDEAVTAHESREERTK